MLQKKRKKRIERIQGVKKVVKLARNEPQDTNELYQKGDHINIDHKVLKDEKAEGLWRENKEKQKLKELKN